MNLERKENFYCPKFKKYICEILYIIYQIYIFICHTILFFKSNFQIVLLYFESIHLFI